MDEQPIKLKTEKTKVIGIYDHKSILTKDDLELKWERLNQFVTKEREKFRTIETNFKRTIWKDQILACRNSKLMTDWEISFTNNLEQWLMYHEFLSHQQSLILRRIWVTRTELKSVPRSKKDKPTLKKKRSVKTISKKSSV